MDSLNKYVQVTQTVSLTKCNRSETDSHYAPTMEELCPARMPLIKYFFTVRVLRYQAVAALPLIELRRFYGHLPAQADKVRPDITQEDCPNGH